MDNVGCPWGSRRSVFALRVQRVEDGSYTGLKMSRHSIPRERKRQVMGWYGVSLVCVVSLWMSAVSLPGRARAGLLTPSASFTDLGTFDPTLGGSYVINTGNGVTTPTLMGPSGSGIDLSGNIYTYGNGSSVAVFEFDSINIGNGIVVTGAGSLPVAFLSYGGATISGTGLINFNGGDGTVNGNGAGGAPFAQGGSGGPGGGAGGASGDGRNSSGSSSSGSPGQGPGGGGGGNTPPGSPGWAGGGGGFGGTGGATSGAGAGTPGPAYGNLTQSLQGGSGGGGAGGLGTVGGGGGGGGIQIGANGAISIGGLGITANGGNSPLNAYVGGGGGSGGGIILNGQSVSWTAEISAAGGAASYPSGAGGGGGGRVLIEYGSGGFSGSLTSVNVAGGPGGYDDPSLSGGNGIVAVTSVSAVPEPSSVLLLTFGLIGATAQTLRRVARGRADMTP